MDNKEERKIPPIEIFVKNNYKQYNIPDISMDKIERMVAINSEED